MNALVRNKSEAEALALFTHVAQRLGLSIELETSAYAEGGLREFWRFIGQNKDQLGWILAIITLLLTRFPVIDRETDALNKEVLRLTIEEKKANIEKVKRELQKDPPNTASVSQAADALEDDLKIVTRRSNFYRVLLTNEKVTAVGVTPLPDEAAVRQEATVQRHDFIRFVQPTNRLPTEVVDGAQIEIVAPVLKEGNYQWKGIYEGEAITFAMGDEEFKASVLSQKVSFQHGSTIECVLNIHRKFDEVGDVVITGYTVGTVLSKRDGERTEQTPQGKRHKFTKAQAAGQGILFQPPAAGTGLPPTEPGG